MSKNRYKFTYTNPKVTYDEEKNSYFIRTFGGKKKYFNDESEYDAYVRQDREKKYRKFLKDHKDVKRTFAEARSDLLGYRGRRSRSRLSR